MNAQETPERRSHKNEVMLGQFETGGVGRVYHFIEVRYLNDRGEERQSFMTRCFHPAHPAFEVRMGCRGVSALRSALELFEQHFLERTRRARGLPTHITPTTSLLGSARAKNHKDVSVHMSRLRREDGSATVFAQVSVALGIGEVPRGALLGSGGLTRLIDLLERARDEIDRAIMAQHDAQTARLAAMGPPTE